MGLRTVAGRLGLGLGLAAATARQEISGLPLCRRRRFSTSTAPAADAREMKGSGSGMELELEFNKSKTLYLCFCELSRRRGGDQYINRVVRPIKLDTSHSYLEKYLTEAAYKRSKVNTKWSHCGRYGSQILFPFGSTSYCRHISWIDTSKQPMKFQGSSPRKTKIKSFSSDKCDALLGELNGKLYCIDRNPFSIDPHSRPFEVLDPENDPKWQPLDAPPFIRDREKKDFAAAFLEGSNKILGWALLQPGVFCFDTTKPETGWKESPSSLSNTLPFISYGRPPSFMHHHLPFMGYGRPPFFMHHHHPTLGAFHLMFTYDPYHTPLLVNTFFMSDNCDSFQRYTPLPLPEWCFQYHCVDYPESNFQYQPPISTDFEFVRLGEQKFCLVLNKFFSYWNMGILLLLTFEYDIIAPVKGSKSTLSIQTQLLGIRRFRYQPRQLCKPDSTWTHEVFLTGAYQL